ncbi:hypothetical protein C3747_9g170 [Trypanosoma cruzi]|uniref:Repressor activator protein 1 n=2 Tax=Trypanosoma cruzi TaxID=5693 RepID=Q4D075_TRYCC|nr:hypothetical protein, conserved [Trypanosoma cruzi]EAN85929.1 hypothetical protein, conserved [Trypanosoma cruzi]PWV19752.1 hypothetical protein C3747_9g170 [Trypanosoma cruzi]RNC42785.1 repressor activator protein 1 [Trypanosoma cruzi]|eukprot:XP_807780.1 hypothetical protein [Trypanosoma cruzi strain CL Brener]
MSSSMDGTRSTWRGVQFFVDVDVLLTFRTVTLSDLEGQPGQPQRRIAVVDGKAVSVVSYPAASFFLKTLRATGNSVVLVTPWKTEKTASLLRLFGWDAFDEIRTILREPGHENFRLSCLNCTLEEYPFSVVVTTSRAAWHTAVWSQVVEVRHETNYPCQSLALLRALSCCLRIAECRVRFPHTAVSSCISFSRARLFSQYRFYLSPEVTDPSSVVMMINEHGGYLVSKYEDATHYVIEEGENSFSCTLQKPRLSREDGERSSSLSSSDSEGSDSSSAALIDVERESSVSLNSDSGEEDNGGASGEFKNFGVNEEQEKKTIHVAMLPPVTTNESMTATEFSTDSVNSSLILPVVNGCHETEEHDWTTWTTPSTSAKTTTAITVTVLWLQDCIDGLLVYPPQVAHSSNDNSQWNISALLLAALIPPSDVEPISLSCLNNIAEDYGFRPLQLSQMGGEVNLATVLQKQWGSVLHVEMRGGELFLRQPSIPPNEAGQEMERHLAFIAEQFCDAWTNAIRNNRLRNMTDSGTQTAAVLMATSGANTDVVLLNSEGATVDPSPQGRLLLMHALGPAEWAKEVDASHMTYNAIRVTEESVSLEPSSSLALVNEPPTGYESPPEVKEVQAISDEKAPARFAQRGVEAEKGQPVVDLAKPPPGGEREFVKCFIPSDGLGDERETLDKDVLLRQPPFRNYPMKLTVDQQGIHCLFVTTFDAKRFYQEGYAEVRNRFLPILPEYAEEISSTVGTRKRRRSRSPVTKRSASNTSRGNRKDAFSSNRDSQSFRGAPGMEKNVDTGGSTELSKSDLELLGEIGATFDFACQHVDVVERYALNELSDPVFRKQQHQLLRVVVKLKRIIKRGN